MDLEHADTASIDVPWRALLASVGGGVLSLCAWSLSGMDLVLIAGMTGSVMLSCVAREPLPRLELRTAPRVRRSRRTRALLRAPMSPPRIAGPAPPPAGQLSSAVHTNWRPAHSDGPRH